MNRICHVIR